MRFYKYVSFALLLLVFSWSAIAQTHQATHAFYLTWTDDPTSSISIDWHSDATSSTTLKFRRKGTDVWRDFESTVLPYPFSERKVHRVGIGGLSPATTYELMFPGLESVYHFHTMPADLNSASIKIAIGGDTMHRKEWFEKTNGIVTSYEPDFVIIGGDMAYENGVAENLQRIYDWFDAYTTTLVTADNRILPCIVAAGNHEVVGGYYSRNPGYEQTNSFRNRIAPYFYSLFPFPGQPGYNVLDFGKYLSLVILDTEHSNPVAGVQTEWLKETLEARKDFLHVLPIYHVPAFPSVRDYTGTTQTIVRDTWVPIFEQYPIRLAFENHDHAYKRTFPIRNGKVDQTGITYVGDGSWGTEPRPIHSVEDTWYLKVAQSVNAFTLLTIEGSQYSLISLDWEGNVIDSYPQNPLVGK
ncbi:MAG: metallophosphoesterase [Mongoliitalea sp.]